MRVVCWNLQGQPVSALGDPRSVLGNVDKLLGADVFIALEAPAGLVGITDASAANGRGGTARYTHFRSLAGADVSFRGDRIFVCAHEAFDVVKLATGHAVHAWQVTVGGFRLVTFHAPYEGGSGGAASTYVEKVFATASAMTPRPDVILGDYNTYGSTVPNAGRQHYTLAMAAATSNHGKGSALDKVAVRQGVDYDACGRAYGRAMNVARLSGNDVTDGRVQDMTASWKALERPDHLPIYIDLAGAGGAADTVDAGVDAAARWDASIDLNALRTRREELARLRRQLGGVLIPDDARELAAVQAREKQLKRQADDGDEADEGGRGKRRRLEAA